MRKSLITASLLALCVAVAPACATKKFVRTSVGEVNSKVDTLGSTVEETQARTKANEGRIDNVGNKMANEKLGLERAETVKRYICEHHQVPLHKINVISYGADKPVAPNKTKAGRAQNRRVVIRVLA